MHRILTGLAAFALISATAQDNNLIVNGSFESTDGKVHGRAEYEKADNISSSNNTTVDLYSAQSSRKGYSIPDNDMGSQGSKTGNNYAGFIAYYGQETGLFKTKPAYQKYSEYIQFELREPMVAGKAYAITFNIALAEKSAFAVSAVGVYFTTDTMDVKNNAYLDVTPHIIASNVLTNTEWSIFSATYVAKGGERHMTLGCFDNYMTVQKVIPENTNNSRKAYYFVDDVSVAPSTIPENDIAWILSGGCYRLNNLNFETDKAVILPESFDELNTLANFLQSYPSIVVYIDGHTDKVGTDVHNDQLSKDRAAAVRSYLTTSGVSEARMKARAYGETLPVENTEAASAVNRRVEITICGDEAVPK